MTKYLPKPARRKHAAQIVEAVADTWDLDPAEIRFGGRKGDVPFARAVAMTLIREITELPLQDIGDIFDGRDYSTVSFAIKKINKARRGRQMREIIEGITVKK